jgi:hypothetical protein
LVPAAVSWLTTRPRSPSAAPPDSPCPTITSVASVAELAYRGALHTDQGSPTSRFAAGSESGAPGIPTGLPRGTPANEAADTVCGCASGEPSSSRADA